jgi:hypothetical protein
VHVVVEAVSQTGLCLRFRTSSAPLVDQQKLQACHHCRGVHSLFAIVHFFDFGYASTETIFLLAANNNFVVIIRVAFTNS